MLMEKLMKNFQKGVKAVNDEKGPTCHQTSPSEKLSPPDFA